MVKLCGVKLRVRVRRDRLGVPSSGLQEQGRENVKEGNGVQDSSGTETGIKRLAPALACCWEALVTQHVYGESRGKLRTD